MSDVFSPSKSQMARIMPCVDDRRDRLCDPKGYGFHKTLYNRFIRWRRPVVFDRIFITLAEQAGRSTHLTAGQVSEFKGTDVLPAERTDGTEELIGDRGYDGNRITCARRNALCFT